MPRSLTNLAAELLPEYLDRAKQALGEKVPDSLKTLLELTLQHICGKHSKSIILYYAIDIEVESLIRQYRYPGQFVVYYDEWKQTPRGRHIFSDIKIASTDWEVISAFVHSLPPGKRQHLHIETNPVIP